MNPLKLWIQTLQNKISQIKFGEQLHPFLNFYGKWVCKFYTLCLLINLEQFNLQLRNLMFQDKTWPRHYAMK